MESPSKKKNETVATRNVWKPVRRHLVIAKKENFCLACLFRLSASQLKGWFLTVCMHSVQKNRVQISTGAIAIKQNKEE